MLRDGRHRSTHAVIAAALTVTLASACAATPDAVIGSLSISDAQLLIRDDGQVVATFSARNDSAVDRAVTLRWPVDDSVGERSLPVPSSGTTVITEDDDVVLTGLAAAPGDVVPVTMVEGFFYREAADSATFTVVVRAP